MSVILYEDEKFLKIYQSLVVKGRELAHLWKYPDGWDKADGMDHHLQAFVCELRRANTATWNRQYPDDVHPLRTLDFKCVLPYNSPVELIKSLQGLSYNLVSNDGKETNLGSCADRLYKLIYDLMYDVVSSMPEYSTCDCW